jgi:hypothetical protein
MLEIELEQKCRKAAEKQECILLKLEKRRGWPDRLLISPVGGQMFIEFKREGEEPRPLQKHIHQMLTAMQHRVEVIDHYTQFLEILVDFNPRCGRPVGIRPVE